jgi:hypothetical protein
VEGRYRRLRPRWWTDATTQSLSNDQKLVSLYLRTGPQTNAVGLYRLSPGAAAEDLGMDPGEFRRQLDIVCRVEGWNFDAIARVLWIPSWPAENVPQSPNVAKSWRSQLDEVPNCAIKATAASAIRAFLAERGQAFLKAFGEASPEESSKPSPIQDQDQEQIQEQVQKQERPPRKRRAASATALAEFERFYSAYPRKIKRSKALKAWEALAPDAALQSRMFEALEWQCRQPGWLEKGGKFIPYPASWLSDRRWEDEPFNPQDPTDAAWEEVEARIATRRTS